MAMSQMGVSLYLCGHVIVSVSLCEGAYMYVYEATYMCD